MVSHINVKRLAAMCAAAASLSTFGLAGSAMAVETPTTADTAKASIVLKAAEGNTLTGHTFTFYRLGSYGDITAGTTGTDVKSLTVNKIDDASDKWIAAANTKAGITDLQGFDAAGDLAHATGDKNRQSPTDAKQTMLREAAKQLADTVAKSGVEAAKTVGGSGSTLTVAGLDNGLYLVVDSNGSPMIVGTPVQGTKTLNSITLGNLTIKSKTVSIDKKVARDRGHKSDFIDSKAGNTETSASWNVGDTVDFSYTFTMPNKQNTGEVQVVDVMDGLKLEDAPVFKVGQTAITPANVANAQDDRGFTATFGRAVIDANENKIVTVTYKATVTDATRAKQASNTATIKATFLDGKTAEAKSVDSPDTATVSAYDLNIHKTNLDGKQNLKGAGFKIQAKNGDNAGKWMAQTGTAWKYVDTQGEATQFLTDGDNGQVNIAGLGAGDYYVEETKIPDGMTSLVTVKFNMHISDGGVVTVDTNAVGDPGNLLGGVEKDKDDASYTITVRNIDALTELPQTGGLLGNTMIGVVVIAMAGGVAYLTVRSRKRREAHAL